MAKVDLERSTYATLCNIKSFVLSSKSHLPQIFKIFGCIYEGLLCQGQQLILVGNFITIHHVHKYIDRKYLSMMLSAYADHKCNKYISNLE